MSNINFCNNVLRLSDANEPKCICLRYRANVHQKYNIILYHKVETFLHINSRNLLWPKGEQQGFGARCPRFNTQSWPNSYGGGLLGKFRHIQQTVKKILVTMRTQDPKWPDAANACTCMYISLLVAV